MKRVNANKHKILTMDLFIKGLVILSLFISKLFIGEDFPEYESCVFNLCEWSIILCIIVEFTALVILYFGRINYVKIASMVSIVSILLVGIWIFAGIDPSMYVEAFRVCLLASSIYLSFSAIVYAVSVLVLLAA